MGRLIVLLMMTVLLTGCGTTTTKTQVVKVPIIICPVPEYIIEPVLAIETLNDEDKGDWEKIAKAYASTIVTQEAHIQKLRAQLQIYRDKRGEQ